MSATDGQLAAPDEVAPGETFGVSLSVWVNASYTITVSAPSGLIWSDSADNVTAGYVVSQVLPVTSSWRFGRGLVEASIVPVMDPDNRTLLMQSFKVICEDYCLADLFAAQLAPVVTNLYVIVLFALMGSLMFVGHAAHIFAIETGDLSWWQRLNMVLALSLHRNPDKRDWVDATGAISAEMKGYQRAVLKIADILHKRKMTEKRRRRLERWRDVIEDEVRELKA